MATRTFLLAAALSAVGLWVSSAQAAGRGGPGGGGPGFGGANQGQGQNGPNQQSGNGGGNGQCQNGQGGQSGQGGPNGRQGQDQTAQNQNGPDQNNNSTNKNKPTIGAIASITASNVTVKLKNGSSRTFAIAETTKATRFGQSISMGSLAIGDLVGVKADSSGNATQIFKLPHRHGTNNSNGNQSQTANASDNQGPPPMRSRGRMPPPQGQ